VIQRVKQALACGSHSQQPSLYFQVLKSWRGQGRSSAWLASFFFRHQFASEAPRRGRHGAGGSVTDGALEISCLLLQSARVHRNLFEAQRVRFFLRDSCSRQRRKAKSKGAGPGWVVIILLIEPAQFEEQLVAVGLLR